MMQIRGFIAVASLLFVFIASFFLLRDFVIYNEEFSSSRAEILKEIWNNHLDEKLDADTTLVLEEILVAIKESVQVPAAHCPKCPECESCSPCEKPEPCPKPKPCPECQICEKCDEESFIQNNESFVEETAEDIAIRLLKTNWEDASDVPEDAKHVDFIDIPVINNFGSFQRNAENYNISRAGYEPRRLVCDELSEHLPKAQTRHWIDDCDDVPKYPDEVLSFINLGLEKSVIDKIEVAGLKSTGKNISTPYVLLAFDLFDFDAEDTNLMRMVREAEAQNADIISGSSVDENGHWVSNCGHIHVSNYTLDIWDGYYKSIRSIMHCDVGSGPVVVRKELLEKITEEETERLAKWPDRLEVLLKLRDRVRFVHCPDCMFYLKESKVDRHNFIRLSRMFKLTNFNIDSNKDNYEFTCNEANIQCSTSSYQNKALAQPPCCLTSLTGMVMAVAEEFEKHNLDLCLYCGQALATIKMPGGQLPWDTDVDMPFDALIHEEVKKLVVPALKEKYGLEVNTGPKTGEGNEGYVLIQHKAAHFSTDHYAKFINTTLCGHQVLKGRAQTKVKIDGWWVPGPDNPGQYGRKYGDEVLKHVPHVDSLKTTYGTSRSKFPKCSGQPSHACLDQFPTDGNIQFRGDKAKLFTVF